MLVAKDHIRHLAHPCRKLNAEQVAAFRDATRSLYPTGTFVDGEGGVTLLIDRLTDRNESQSSGVLFSVLPCQPFKLRLFEWSNFFEGIEHEARVTLDVFDANTRTFTCFHTIFRKEWGQSIVFKDAAPNEVQAAPGYVTQLQRLADRGLPIGAVAEIRARQLTKNEQVAVDWRPDHAFVIFKVSDQLRINDAGLARVMTSLQAQAPTLLVKAHQTVVGMRQVGILRA